MSEIIANPGLSPVMGNGILGNGGAVPISRTGESAVLPDRQPRHLLGAAHRCSAGRD